MLSLDSPAWHKLHHAYGPAGDVPTWIRALEPESSSNGNAEPWFSIWSALAHQDDVFSASFAAVPHIITILANAPERADVSFFHFPAWVEICRHNSNAEVPAELRDAYQQSLAKLPSLVAAAATSTWKPEYLASCMAAIAVAKGQPAMAEAALELNPEVASSFMAWVEDQ